MESIACQNNERYKKVPLRDMLEVKCRRYNGRIEVHICQGITSHGDEKPLIHSQRNKLN